MSTTDLLVTVRWLPQCYGCFLPIVRKSEFRYALSERYYYYGLEKPDILVSGTEFCVTSGQSSLNPTKSGMYREIWYKRGSLPPLLVCGLMLRKWSGMHVEFVE